MDRRISADGQSGGRGISRAPITGIDAIPHDLSAEPAPASTRKLSRARQVGIGLGIFTALGMIGFVLGQHPWSAPMVPLGAAKSAHMSVSRSQLQQIESQPKAHRGENVIVYAQVATIDPGPWDDRFLGYAAERPITQDSFLSCLDYARFTGAHAALNNLVENDVVKVWATVLGPEHFDTPVLDTTIPSLYVNHIDVVGHVR